MLKPIKLSVIFLSIFLVFFIIVPALVLAPPAVSAEVTEGPDQGTGEGSISSDNVKILGQNVNTSTLDGFLQLVIAVSNFILGLVGALSLAAFVFGGILWMISAGDAEKVNRGKQAIIGAVVGLAIVFTSYMIIQLVFTALGVPGAESGKWATSGWTKTWAK